MHTYIKNEYMYTICMYILSENVCMQYAPICINTVGLYTITILMIGVVYLILIPLWFGCFHTM